MPTAIYNKFNRGEVSQLALVRDDYEKVKNSCQFMENFMPLRLGSMIYRPGTEFIYEIQGDSKIVHFLSKIDESVMLIFTNNQVRVVVDDVAVSTTATTTDFFGSFAGSIWVDSSDAGCSSSSNNTYASLFGTDFSSGSMYLTSQNVESGVPHTLRFFIERAGVEILIGESGVDSKEFFSGELSPGEHFLTFTPSANFTVTMKNVKYHEARVESVTLLSVGEMVFQTTISESELSGLKYDQSADVIFFTLSDGTPFQIERRGNKSWSLVDTRVDKPPFDIVNSTSVKFEVDEYFGDAVLTSSVPNFFNAESVGDIYRIFFDGKRITELAYEANYATKSIKISGVGVDREFSIAISSTIASYVVSLERSEDNITWKEFQTYTVDTSGNIDDQLTNQILYYRLKVTENGFDNGVAGEFIQLLINDDNGAGDEGICRVINNIDGLTANIQILSHFSRIAKKSAVWSKSVWNSDGKKPNAVGFYEGRLWYAGQSLIWGSESDNYQSFDAEIEGDSKAIAKTIGFGAVDDINWITGTSQMIVGLSSNEVSVRSSSFAELITATNMNLKTSSNQGSNSVKPIIIDNDILFAQRSDKKMIRAEYESSIDNLRTSDLMILNESICEAGIKAIAVSRHPETRVYVVLNSGEVRVYLYDKSEDVYAWSRIKTSGTVLDVIVSPARDEDIVYFVVERSQSKTYLEKMSKMSDYASKHLDNFSSHSSPGTTISGLSRLEGESVRVFADGEIRGDFTVSGGSITVGSSWSDVVVGIKYEAKYISNMLGQYDNYSVLTKRKRVYGLGIIANLIHIDPFNSNSTVLSFSFDDVNANYKSMPFIEDGKLVSSSLPVVDYNYTPFEFNGNNDTDSRVFIKATGACSIMAMTYEIKDPQDKANKQKRPK